MSKECKPILVVDDDRDLATMMKRFLEHHGWRVVVVTDPRSAITRVIDAGPALVLVAALAPGGLLAITVLSEVDAEPGPFRAPPGELRAALCGSQVIGLAMIRYVVRLEPLASADPGTVAAAIGPTLQRYLSEDLS